jgi:hypothetical protein
MAAEGEAILMHSSSQADRRGTASPLAVAMPRQVAPGPRGQSTGRDRDRRRSMNRDSHGRYLPSPALTLARNLRAIAELVMAWRNAPGLELWQRIDGEFRVLRHWP